MFVALGSGTFLRSPQERHGVTAVLGGAEG